MLVKEMPRKKDPNNPAREIVNVRMRPELVRRIEMLAAHMPASPTKSQLIEQLVKDGLDKYEKEFLHKRR